MLGGAGFLPSTVVLVLVVVVVVVVVVAVVVQKRSRRTPPLGLGDHTIGGGLPLASIYIYIYIYFTFNWWSYSHLGFGLVWNLQLGTPWNFTVLRKSACLFAWGAHGCFFFVATVNGAWELEHAWADFMWTFWIPIYNMYIYIDCIYISCWLLIE